MEILNQIILIILAPIAASLGYLLAKLIRKAIQKIDDNRLQELAYAGVRWASETLGRGTGTGQDKHHLVRMWLADKTSLPITEIDKAIKAAVNAVRDELGERDAELLE